MESTFSIKNASGTSTTKLGYSNTEGSSDVSLGVSDYQYQFTSPTSYTDEGIDASNQGFVYSADFDCTNGNNANDVFGNNFPASTNNYYLSYNVTSTNENANATLDKNGNTSASRTTGDFYVDNYSTTPTVTFTSDPTTTITDNTFLFGIPSVTRVNIAATFEVSSFANNYIPHTGDVHSFVSAITKNAYSMGVKNTSNVYQTSTYTVTYNETDSSITAGRYDANTTSDFTVNVYYLDNTGTPSIVTHTDNTKDSTNVGKVFRDTANTYSGNATHFFDGVDTISSAAITTDSTNFTGVYPASNLNSVLLYFNQRFVAGGYDALYNGTEISPFSDWSTSVGGFAVNGPDYSSYADTGVGGFKWIALNVTNKKSGSNINLTNFNINNSHYSTKTFGTDFKAYISYDGMFGSLAATFNSGATLWYNNLQTNITVAESSGLYAQALDSNFGIVDSTFSGDIYLVVGLPQDSASYFTFS